MTRPVVMHVTASDMSLDYLLGTQLQAAVAAGYDVRAASAPGPYVPALEAAGIRHHPLREMSRGAIGPRDGRAFRELRRLFDTERPDLVHTHTPKAGVLGRLAARSAGIRAVVNTQHGLYATAADPWRRRLPVLAAERLAAACSRMELVQNSEDMATLRRLGVPRTRLCHLGNGIDVARFDPGAVSATSRDRMRARCEAGPDDVLVAAVGRLVAEKGYLDLIAALSRIDPGARPVVAVAGGHEPDKGDALGEADLERGRRAGVRFLGLVEPIEELYAAADVLVHPSHREGMPRAPMEAAAMGVPTVATDIRGCRQVIDDRVTGLLVTPRSASELSGAIERLVTHVALRQELGRAARQKALREFDDRRVIETVLDTYAALVEPPVGVGAP